MNDISVFNTINESNFECPRIKQKSFKRGDTITSYIDNRNMICILLSGEADLIRYDFNGNETVLEHFQENTIFGELFYSISSNTQLVVIAKSDVKVSFMDYDFLFKTCNKNCKQHDTLVENLIMMLSKKIIKMTDHIEMLTKKSIREKLLSYFSNISYYKSSKSFKIPLTLTELASYLNIDRSAMMRELKYLKEEGFIKKEGKRITLLF